MSFQWNDTFFLLFKYSQIASFFLAYFGSKCFFCNMNLIITEKIKENVFVKKSDLSLCLNLHITFVKKSQLSLCMHLPIIVLQLSNNGAFGKIISQLNDGQYTSSLFLFSIFLLVY